MKNSNVYNALEAEACVLKAWEEESVFSFEDEPEREARGFVLPPPNITGRLHIGHALNATLIDILVRWRRMQGYSVLWQPGVDHASIATQAVVERALQEKGRPSRQELGRQAFLREVFAWKDEHGAIIESQLKRLGVACDFSRSRFTMDAPFVQMVIRVFVALYQQGFIYRAKRLVNWDPKLGTAISDLEVLSVETNGHLYYIRYPIVGQEDRFIVVATTRPETLFGDVAVAVPLEDSRVGLSVHVPISGRVIPVVGDMHAHANIGSGAVKITPAHDFNDFKVGQRHQLPLINIFTPTMHLNEEVPPSYQGLAREEARKNVVADLEHAGLIEKIEPHQHNVPHGDRSHEVIEPYLTDQWYVDAPKLAQASIAAVSEGEITFFPAAWAKNYFEWMNNLEPWCISRQLWWGHQVPVWYAPDGTYFVACALEEALDQAKAHFGHEVALQQDTDVLDTWFSSALWPFAALDKACQLGASQKVELTSILQRYYPIDTLITSFDIIFFWVARMIMMGVHFLDRVPFHRVYIHALVRDEKGQKMSKSKGNVIDPLVIAEQYGTDAMRMSLAALTVQGRDIKLSLKHIEGWRNFTTKLWNSARFCQMNHMRVGQGMPTPSLPINQWIRHACDACIQTVTHALENLCFNEAIAVLYQFTWHTFCDRYLESIKPVSKNDEETCSTMGFVLLTILKLLHPFAPFCTDFIARSFDLGDSLLLKEQWPTASEGAYNPQAICEVEQAFELVAHIRSLRAHFKCNAASYLKLAVVKPVAHAALVKRLARLEEIFETQKPFEGARFVLHNTFFVLHLGQDIDILREKERLAKDISQLDKRILEITTLLANQAFLSKSKPEIIEEKEVQLAHARAQIEKLQTISAGLI